MWPNEVPALRDMTSRLIVVNVAGLEKKRDILKRYMAAYRETLDWLYTSPDAIKAYAAWSGLSERLARQAPEYITKDSVDPIRIVGLEDMMVEPSGQIRRDPRDLALAAEHLDRLAGRAGGDVRRRRRTPAEQRYL